MGSCSIICLTDVYSLACATTKSTSDIPKPLARLVLPKHVFPGPCSDCRNSIVVSFNSRDCAAEARTQSSHWHLLLWKSQQRWSGPFQVGGLQPKYDRIISLLHLSVEIISHCPEHIFFCSPSHPSQVQMQHWQTLTLVLTFPQLTPKQPLPAHDLDTRHEIE